jgi:hypothetical protein
MIAPCSLIGFAESIIEPTKGNISSVRAFGASSLIKGPQLEKMKAVLHVPPLLKISSTGLRVIRAAHIIICFHFYTHIYTSARTALAHGIPFRGESALCIR